MFEEGSTSRAIINALAKALDFVLHRQAIADDTGFTISAIRSALYRLHKKNLVANSIDDPDNITKGFWRLRRIYRKIRHTKRIIETRQSKKRREWNCDCEATSEGFVPYYPTEFRNYDYPVPPDMPEDTVTSRYANVLNPKLREEMLRILGMNDIILIDGLVAIETADRPRFFPAPKYAVEGTEWLDDIEGIFNPAHKVEVVFVNDTGTMYSPESGAGTWSGSFQVSEDGF